MSPGQMNLKDEFSFSWVLCVNRFRLLFPCQLVTSPPPQPFYGPFLRDHPGEPVPEENFWTLWCKGRLTEADTLTTRLGATPSWLTSAYLHHPPFLQAGCPSCHPTNSVKASDINDHIIASVSLRLLHNSNNCFTACASWHLQLTSISSHWQTRATRCVTANVMQTNKADAPCDKHATELSWQHFTFKVANLQLLHLHLTYPTCIWCLRSGWHHLNFAKI